MCDEGYIDDLDCSEAMAMDTPHVLHGLNSEQECEDLVYKLLASLPRSRLAKIQRRLAPLLQFDVVGSLPLEVSLRIFSYLQADTLLKCALISRRWQTLANDPAIWKQLCSTQGWKWRQPSPTPIRFEQEQDDEGMGDSDEEEVADSLTFDDAMQLDDSGFVSFTGTPPLASSSGTRQSVHPPPISRPRSRPRPHSAPSILHTIPLTPDYKLLHQTHVRLQNRVRAGSYRLSALQTRGAPTNAHANTIYCLQLYTYPGTGKQVLFTGSRDKTVREWNIATGLVERVISGVHAGSVLSICVANGLLASAGSDRRVAVWDLDKNKVVKVIEDHEDSVLCVRFDSARLVSCSKDRTVRTYTFPELRPEHVLQQHRAAVNAVSLASSLIVTGSGDRSIKLWEAATGKLLRTFEAHHTRGIAAIDVAPPFILSGSSDKHLRLIDITTSQGWATVTSPSHVCQSCGQPAALPQANESAHGDLVRSVALGPDFVMSGSYDLSIKVWDRKTGALVANLTGGHTGRIFCIGFDCTKMVSCGEDQRICIWDFAHGMDTSFLEI